MYKFQFSLWLFFASSLFCMESPSSNFLQAARISDTPRMRQLIAGVCPQHLESALAEAIKRFDFTTCRFIINETPLNCNAIVNGHSLISYALFYKNSIAAGLLLDKQEFDFKQRTRDGLTILEALAQYGLSAPINSLLQKKIFTAQDCKNALIIAVLNDQDDMVTELLNHGTSPNDGYSHNKTPLHRAAEKGNLKNVQSLLKAGAFVDKEDNNGYTPLYIAVSRRLYKIAQNLVAHGASIETTYNVASSIHDLVCIDTLRRWFSCMQK